MNNPRIHIAFRGGDRDERPGWWFGFAYDVDVVDRLKVRVPARERTWDGAAKLWWVADAYEETIREMFGASFEAYLQQGSLL